MPSHHKDAHRLHINERAKKAKDLRVLGYSYPAIAEANHTSVETARQDVKRYTEDLPKEEALEYRQQQVELHELMISRWAAKALKGDYKAAMVVAKYDQMRTELLGTNRIDDDNGEQAARDDLAAMMDAIKGAAS